VAVFLLRPAQGTGILAAVLFTVPRFDKVSAMNESRRRMLAVLLKENPSLGPFEIGNDPRWGGEIPDLDEIADVLEELEVRRTKTQTRSSNGTFREASSVPVKRVEDSAVYEALPVPRRPPGMPVASLVLGILSLVLWLLPILGLPASIAGMVFGVNALKRSDKGLAIAAVVLCSIGLVLSAANAAIGAYLGATGQR
jgi:hypothetical protein